MKAMVVPKTGELTLEELDVPSPQAGEVLVRLAATGVCHTDLSALRGSIPLQTFPIVLGHEGAGVVQEVGPGVQDIAVGDHVVLTIIISCGACYQCLLGNYGLCSLGTAHALGGTMLDGTTRLRKGSEVFHHFFCQSSFAEYAVVPASVAVPVRKDAPLDKIAVLGCGATTGIGAVLRRAKVPAGSSVAVIGAGGVGLSCVMGARAVGAYPIIAIDIQAEKLELARQFGATHVVNSSSPDAAEAVTSILGRGVDYSFDAVGATGTLELAVQILRPGGEAVAIGLMDLAGTVTLDIFSLLFQKRLTGTYGGSVTPRLDIPAMVDLFMDGRLPLDQLVSKEYSLEQLPDAFEDMEAGKLARGVLVF